jgi:hypothetical protein
VIFANGFGLPADGFQQVGQPQLQVRGSSRSAFCEHLAVQANDGF